MTPGRARHSSGRYTVCYAYAGAIALAIHRPMTDLNTIPTSLKVPNAKRMNVYAPFPRPKDRASSFQPHVRHPTLPRIYVDCFYSLMRLRDFSSSFSNDYPLSGGRTRS